ncbi:mannosyl-oligosaccharide alpha-1,2-mannosidase [Trichoderma harzianum]|uniref:alpha-1,2-Mannosidase n=1 Tax=Trichoderma harzianum TaxID=5544 RepID=A0A0F9XJR0_TRIHA|nr:mannosyl-oligosaccharide alpha-1,2-mannosidase [Trichoderma harzianum]
MARRRYRLFMVCAVVILFLLYRVSQNTWEDPAQHAGLYRPPTSNSPATGVESPPKPPPKPAPEPENISESKPKPQPEAEAKPKPESKPEPEHASSQSKQSKQNKPDDEDDGLGVKIPKLKELDDSKPAANGEAPGHAGSKTATSTLDPTDEDEVVEDIHQKNPPKNNPGKPVDTRIHWRPVSEHFPVNSIISLPTGKPQKVPRVQHEFGVESPEAKSRRVTRQERVAKEIERAWSGYKKFAWMHDELSPVSAKHRDPFCGWAATLVDSLDTLWIAGLKEEFDEAAKAVEAIDFTTTPRNNIPVFETTIRYLGGLLGAFDVSGGHDGGYIILLNKAVELAEILMGIFDTPNRMPILYYQWQPEYASQPHRAGSVGIAELGTLSMEFTRLAQLTSNYKYYDAVDRITDALVELQKQGTSIPGLFPENLDASGCNHTATAIRSSLSEAAQKQMDEDLSKKPDNFIPGKGPKSESQNAEKASSQKQSADGSDFIVGKLSTDEAIAKLQAADDARAKALDKAAIKPAGKSDSFVVGKIGSEDPRDDQTPAAKTDVSDKGFVVGKIGAEDPRDDQTLTAKTDVSDQGFVVGKIGAEDPRDDQKIPDASGTKSSEFLVGKIGTENPEYAKQGPREDDKTETRPLDSLRRRDTIPGENTYMEKLSQVPQVPSQRTAKRGKPPFAADGFTANWDCVPQGLEVGGYGFQQYHMGGGQDSAYEYFPKEYLLLGGLESKYQKLYEDTVEAINEWLLYRPMTDGDWDILFPAKVSTGGNPSEDLSATFEVTHLTCFIGGMYGLGGKIFGREKDLEIAKKLTDGCVWAYQSTVSGIMPEGSQVLPCPSLEKCAFNETLWWEKLDPAKDWRDKQVAEWEEKKAAFDKQQGSKDPRKTSDKDKEAAGEALKETAQDHGDSASNSKAIHKRAAVPPPKSRADEDVGSELPQSLKDKIGLKGDEQNKPAKSGVGIQREPGDPIDSVLEAHRLPPQEPEEQQIILPEKPETHEEFVQKHIADYGLAPGVVHITSRQYILRPEAIESVWYMYRITGDPIWMEKGWKMFEATISATRTEIANSAVDDVNSPEPGLKDEMESFWLAETLKYYYLLFSEPNVISLDEWVLNTEAHPFKRPGGSVIGHSI